MVVLECIGLAVAFLWITLCFGGALWLALRTPLPLPPLPDYEGSPRERAAQQAMLGPRS